MSKNEFYEHDYGADDEHRGGWVGRLVDTFDLEDSESDDGPADPGGAAIAWVAGGLLVAIVVGVVALVVTM